MKFTEDFLNELDQTLKLIPLSYDRAFKRVFKMNLDILKEFLNVAIPLDLNENDKLSLLDSEIPVTNDKERKNIVDILVVINNEMYIAALDEQNKI